MGAVRQRAIAGLHTHPVLQRHVRLRFDPVRQAWALLSPERIFWPDEIGLDILRRCNGETSVRAMVTSLAAEYDAGEEEVEADVLAFLQEWADKLLVRLQ